MPLADHQSVAMGRLVLVLTGVTLTITGTAQASSSTRLRSNALSTPDQSTPGSPAPRSDSRLTTKIHEIQVGGSITEYVNLLNTKTAVSHRAEAPWGDHALLALNLDVSLGDLHRAIARNYQLTWRSSEAEPPEYVLDQSESDRKVREAAELALRRRAQAEMQARWGDVRRLASLPPAQISRLAVAGDGMAQSFTHPLSVAMARMLFQLPEGAMSGFWRTGAAQVRVSSLSPETQELARAVARQDLPDRDLVTRDGQIDLITAGTPDRPTIFARLSYGRDFVEYNLLYNEGVTRQPPADRRRLALARPSKTPPDQRFKLRISLKDGPREPSEPGQRPAGAKPLAALLQALAAQVDLPILAECDYKPKDARWLRDQWWLEEDIVKQPLPRALDLLCADFECEWRFHDGFLLLRPRLWFLEPSQRVYSYPKFKRVQ